MKDTGSWGRRGRHTLFEFITKTPDGTRVTDDSFEKRHRIVLFSIAIQLPILFAISRFTGLGALTGVEFPSIPFSHSFAGVGGIAAIATLAAVPSLSRRTRSLLCMKIGFRLRSRSSMSFFNTASLVLSAAFTCTITPLRCSTRLRGEL